MQPIIRRTITITITETWTITWPDGRETVWAETHEVVSPVVVEPETPRLPLTDDDECADATLDPDEADPTADDEQGVGLLDDFLSTLSYTESAGLSNEERRLPME